MKTNIPFNKRSPAQKRVNDTMGDIPNINIRKINADAKSIPPRILTNMIILKI